MELQELLNTTAAALVDTAQKHEDARAKLGNAQVELAAREREVENLRWQVAALQKRAEESYAVQEKMRYLIFFYYFPLLSIRFHCFSPSSCSAFLVEQFLTIFQRSYEPAVGCILSYLAKPRIFSPLPSSAHFGIKLIPAYRAFMKEQEANLEGSKRRVVAETEHIFREMRGELERNQFALKMEVRRREAFARAVAGVIGGAQAEALLRHSGIQPEGIGGESEVERSGGGYFQGRESLRKEDLWSSHSSSSGLSKFS